jgi:predicted O-linked N-acetylglucosamine transferase (SPINDLY family)
MGRFDEAAAAFGRAIEIRPDYADAHGNLGNTHREQGRADLAVESYRTALKLKPHSVVAHSGLIFAMHFDSDCDAKSILKETKNWSQQHEQTLSAQVHPFVNDRFPDRRLRIGYVSPDFRTHPVARFILPLLRNHDPTKFEIFCYSGVKRPDAVTQTMQKLAHHWQSTVGLSDPDLAGQIRNDKIDILIDLSLHSAENRLLTFARKPAPVQVTYLGYPGTTGLGAMDYRLSDPHLDGPDSSDYSEKTIRLAGTYYCSEPPENSPPVNSLPAMESGFITFGSLNNFAKVSPSTIDLWIHVLNSLANSHLLIKADPGSHVDGARRMIERAGIAPDRIHFIERVPMEEYLSLFHRVDIALDPIPYSGHATTMDALWMGVPTITLRGPTAVGRGGVSILSNLGMTDWIAETPDQYVAIAARQSKDLAALSELRTGLRQRMLASPLMNGRQFAADVESAYREMWQNWCAGKR